MKSYQAKFSAENCTSGSLAKVAKFHIQILIILWFVNPINTNSILGDICHFPPLNTSILGKDSQIQLIFLLNTLVFQINGKQSYSFPALSRFCNCLCVICKTFHLFHGGWSLRDQVIRTQSGRMGKLCAGYPDKQASKPLSDTLLVSAKIKQKCQNYFISNQQFYRNVQ